MCLITQCGYVSNKNKEYNMYTNPMANKLDGTMKLKA